MKVLVTGAAGRVANWIVPLLSPALDLRLIDLHEGTNAGRDIQSVDITDYAALLEATRGVDAILHLAIPSARSLVTDKALFESDEGEEYLRFNGVAIDVNVRGTYHIFEAARAAGVRRVVYGSSMTVLLGYPRYSAFNDELPARPSNFYGVTKLWGEQLAEYFSRRHGITAYCLRFGNPYPQPDVEEFEEWSKIPIERRCSVTFIDLAASVERALTVQNGPSFGTYSIVSACAGSLFDCSKAAAEIGWRSRTRCEPDGSIIPIG